MSKGGFKNDATLKQLGIEYQKLIALEKCLKALPNENVYIECFGDVADESESVEVKHHHNDHDLINNSEDFWKTLKNHIEEFKISNTFSKLILHTTSNIPERSMFYEWNQKSIALKIKSLKDHTPSKTIKPFYDKVLKASDDQLNSILEKFEILSSQPKIKEKWEQLKNDNIFKLIPNKHLDNALKLLYGYISKKAFEGSKWEININDFFKDCKDSLSKFVTQDVMFHKVEENEIDIDGKTKYEFIQKLENIKLKQTAIQNAISDYMRTQTSKIQMLQATPTLDESLENYEKTIERNIKEAKEEKAIRLSIEDLASGEATKKSEELYYQCIRETHPEIENVKGTEKYYRNGCIHFIVEGKRFDWEYSEIEL